MPHAPPRGALEHGELVLDELEQVLLRRRKGHLVAVVADEPTELLGRALLELRTGGGEMVRSRRARCPGGG